MQSIVKEVLPRITLQEFNIDKKQPRHKARFYVELDWDKFYMQFPIMQELKSEFMNLKEHFGRESEFHEQFTTFLNDTMPDIENIETSQEYIMTLNTQAMRENKTKNKEVFKVLSSALQMVKDDDEMKKRKIESELSYINLFFNNHQFNKRVGDVI